MSNVLFYEPFYDFERLFEQAWAARQRGVTANTQTHVPNTRPDGIIKPFRPRMDLHEDAENNVVTATFELPGLKKENVLIDVHDHRVTVSAESRQSERFHEHGFAIRERRIGKFSRTLQLPVGVKDEEIKASMEHGLLTLTFPKSATDLPPKKAITIQ
ncbi:hypothetical protein NLJ89_g4981 [Agrocybe chaxingu]|uniref:SHSP domain-containing protein n=1 Tax=Agrocybe chaxingu TaxID=84603 RepID=A0A9W8MW11_9AGAR|nr:hypothetical protein NLJ89_g4981 [Agrocybe chaxingu]